MTFGNAQSHFVDQKQQNQQNGTTESTKWENISTKWATETARGVTETTKWESKKQQSGQQVLYKFFMKTQEVSRKKTSQNNLFLSTALHCENAI